MSEFEDKLGAILGNQEAMGRIMALAQSLSGGKEPLLPQQEYVPVEPVDEKESLSQTVPAVIPDAAGILGSLDPKLIQSGMRLLQEYNRTDDRNVALLTALRPFIKEERAAKMDRAVQIARLSRVIRVMFDVMRENGGGLHV